MFLGISHLLLATDGKKKSTLIDTLKNIGYKIDFVENKLINNKEKFNFIFNKNKYHNVIYLKHKTRYAIEIIEYKEIENVKTNLLISFEEKLSNEDMEVYKILDHSIYYNKALNIEYFISSKNRFIFKTRNVEQEIKFWNQLGFKNIDCKVNIKSPLFQWRGSIDFISSNCKYNYMDNMGVNTLCLLTNNINKDKIKINTDKSETFKMNINKKEMNILLIKRDSYNIELLEIK
jgi:hypothetical protein